MKKFFIAFIFFGIISCNSDKSEEETSIQDSTEIESIEEYKEMKAVELNTDEVPESIKSTIEYQFTDYKIKEYEKFSNGNFKVILEKNDIVTSVVLTKSGKIIKIID